MTQEDRKLLLIDLCARLPFDIKCQFTLKYGDNGHKEGIYIATITTFDGKNWLEVEYNDTSGASGKPWMRDWSCSLDDIKPYLRPMSSMTEEEQSVFSSKCELTTDANGEKVWAVKIEGYDWLNAHYFDYRGLIEKGLAIAVTKENNPYNTMEE